VFRTSLAELTADPAALTGRVLVDFDHTLFGGNSTELFIAHSRPRFLVACADVLIRRCAPWRLTGVRKWFRLRDYVFCRFLFWLLPANLARWQYLGRSLFDQGVNHELETLLATTPRDKLAILTFGMAPIVEPMLRGSRWDGVLLLATPHRADAAHFAKGKLEMARHAFGDESLSSCMLITDSEDDLDLLAEVGYPVLINPVHSLDL